jgi:4-diphosphocytidyl-2-C-methyl-D-erythritol kinase
MSSATTEAPAKLNLVLDVLARRPDGFHQIESLMIGVGLYDRLTVENTPGDDVELHCDVPDVPTDASNLVHRAAVRLAQKLNRRAGCRIRLEKRIPIGGGMAGGSSDAAATLTALNRMWHGGLESAALAELGATLGSDVPFFFALPSAIVSGRGEQVRPVRLKWRGWALLVHAGAPVSTREVYERHQVGAGGPKRPPITELVDRDNAKELRACLRNSLEEAVFAVAPQVRRLRDALTQMGLPSVRVAGAGSVLFTLHDDEAEASALQERIRSRGLVETAMVVRAPVA